jgi:hypothetical protein
MSTQTAPVPAASPEVTERAGRRRGLIVLLVIALAASAGMALSYRASQQDHPPTYTSGQLQALADLVLPSQFEAVDSTWSCEFSDQNACFTSTLPADEAVVALASAMGSREYSTVVGNRTFPDRFNFCTTIDAAPAVVSVAALPTNAVNESGIWIVPPGQDPKFGGSAIDVRFTESGTCP